MLLKHKSVNYVIIYVFLVISIKSNAETLLCHSIMTQTLEPARVVLVSSFHFLKIQQTNR